MEVNESNFKEFTGEKDRLVVLDFWAEWCFVPCLTGLSDGARRMKVRLNENEEIVRTVKEGLKAKGGYCPCRVGKSEDIKCPCLEFRSQIADPDFEGYCHCMLYYKEK